MVWQQIYECEDSFHFRKETRIAITGEKGAVGQIVLVFEQI